MMRPWLLVALLWVVALLNYLDRQVIFSLFPLLQKDLGATDVQLGLTSTVFLWVYGLLSPFAGYLADRFGRARIIIASLLVWSVVTWLTGMARNMTELLIARALMGVSEACYLPAALALIVESHPERTRSLAAGVHQSGLYTGMILGGAWGGWMGDHYGWRPVFTLLGLMGIGYFVLLWFVLRNAGRRDMTAEAPNFATSLRTLFALPGFSILTIVFTAFAVQNWIVYTWLPVYLYERFGMSLASAGFSATFYIQMAGFAGILAGGWMADRWSRTSPRGRVLTQVLGLAIGAPFLFLIGFTGSFVLLIIALLAYGFGRGLYDANTMPVLSQIAEPRLRATGYGIFNMAGCIVGGVAAAAAGSLKAIIGLSVAFQVSAVILLLGAAMLWFVPIGRRPISQTNSSS
ncbi:MAG TPA: MFS transporter [Bryobacteraceae bacterium]|nr:MFS transporter [Bryobacteraceae bacterium]